MKNTYKLKIYGILLSLLLALLSCQKDSFDNVNKNEVTYKPEVRDYLAQKIATNLAASLSQITIKEYLKEKALEQFDGDYNFLVELSKDDPVEFKIKNGKAHKINFGDILTGSFTNSSLRMNGENSFFDSLARYYPLMQIAIPALSNESVESWNISDESPLVAFIPSRIENNIIPAYDRYGNYHELSASVEPDELVIVISENERLMVFQKPDGVSGARGNEYPTVDGCPLSQDPYYENDQNLYYFRSDVYDEINGCTGGVNLGGGSGAGQTNDTSCDRDRKSGKDKLYRMIFNSMKDFRKVNEWFDGGQDLEVTIFFGQANGTLSKVTKAFSGRDKDFKKCSLFKCEPEWFYLGDVEIVTWDKDVYGSAMLYTWVEKDGGNTVEINSSFSTTYESDDGTKSTYSFSVKNTIQDKDDILYESIVEYCDNTDGAGYTYNTGKIKFQVRQ